MKQTKFQQAKYKTDEPVYLNGELIPFVISASEEQGWVFAYRTKDGEKTDTKILRCGVVKIGK